MKKRFLILACLGLFAVATTSCDKSCTCKFYTGGVLISTSEITVESGKKCKDYTTYSESTSTGLKCK